MLIVVRSGTGTDLCCFTHQPCWWVCEDMCFHSKITRIIGTNTYGPKKVPWLCLILKCNPPCFYKVESQNNVANIVNSPPHRGLLYRPKDLKHVMYVLQNAWHLPSFILLVVGKSLKVFSGLDIFKCYPSVPINV